MVLPAILVIYALLKPPLPNRSLLEMKPLQTTEDSTPTLAATRRVWMTLSGDYKKRGAALLHQQCWCWGYDVRRQVAGERANLLVELGFERVPPPDGVHGATTYRLRQSDGSTVTLWGFGLCFGDEAGGIFVSRFAFWPRLGATAAPERAFAAKHLASFRAARRLDECERALDYFGRALHWIAHYEQLAADVAGASHRAAALEAWSRGVASHKAMAPDTLAQTWRELAAQTGQVARLWCRENNRTRQVERPATTHPDFLPCQSAGLAPTSKHFDPFGSGRQPRKTAGSWIVGASPAESLATLN